MGPTRESARAPLRATVEDVFVESLEFFVTIWIFFVLGALQFSSYVQAQHVDNRTN